MGAGTAAGAPAVATTVAMGLLLVVLNSAERPPKRPPEEMRPKMEGGVAAGAAAALLLLLEASLEPDQEPPEVPGKLGADGVVVEPPAEVASALLGLPLPPVKSVCGSACVVCMRVCVNPGSPCCCREEALLLPHRVAAGVLLVPGVEGVEHKGVHLGAHVVGVALRRAQLRAQGQPVSGREIGGDRRRREEEE
jgi:hypothetical protein